MKGEVTPLLKRNEVKIYIGYRCAYFRYYQVVSRRTFPVFVITDGNRKRLLCSGMCCRIFLLATDLLEERAARMYCVSVNVYFFVHCTFVLNPRVRGNKLTPINHSHNYGDSVDLYRCRRWAPPGTYGWCVNNGTSHCRTLSVFPADAISSPDCDVAIVLAPLEEPRLRSVSIWTVPAWPMHWFAVSSVNMFFEVTRVWIWPCAFLVYEEYASLYYS
jgi:hypothetical protein